jgi:nucleoside-diphosphate-sugar epimerase
MLTERISSLAQKPTYIRCIGDLAIVHLCMLSALPLTALLEVSIGRDLAAGHLLQDFWPYYFSFFLPLSLIFPAMFLLIGLYKKSDANSGRWKPLITACSAGATVVVFFIADYFVFHNHFSSRSLVLVFCLLVMLAIPFTRFAKTVIVSQLSYEGDHDLAKTDPSAQRRSILIVGGAGYIGSILARSLLSNGYRVRVLDKLVYGDSAIRELIGSDGFELLVGDCRNIQSVSRAMTGMQVVIHLAAIVGDPACDLDHKTTLEINYAATRMLAEVAKGCGTKRFIFASSCSVYGESEDLVNETSPVAPISLYGQTKVDSEKTLLMSQSEEFAPVILRFATVFGHSYRPRFDLVVNLLTAKARQEGVITIFNGQQWRPFIHVQDVVRALVAALEAPLEVVGGQMYNVGDSRLNWTLTEIAAKVRTVFPDTKVVQVDNADRRNYRVCFDKIHNQLGFECQTTVEAGIVEMKQAFDDGLVVDYTNVDYHNQRYLSHSGSPANTQELDSQIMAAFAGVGSRSLAATASR